MLENTEGASENEQSRETGNVGTRDEDKPNKNRTHYLLDITIRK